MRCISLLAAILIAAPSLADSFSYGRAKTGYIESLERIPTTQHDESRAWALVLPDGSTNWVDYTEHTNDAWAAADAIATNSFIMLDGTGDKVTILDQGSLSFLAGSPDSPFTYSSWIKPDASWDRTGSFYAKSDGATEGEYYTTIAANIHVRFVDAAGDLMGVYVANTIPLGLTTLFTVTYDGSGTTNGINVYFDDRLQVILGPSVSGVYNGMIDTIKDLSLGTLDGVAFFTGGFGDPLLLSLEMSAIDLTNRFITGSETYTNPVDINYTNDLWANTYLSMHHNTDETDTYNDASSNGIVFSSSGAASPTVLDFNGDGTSARLSWDGTSDKLNTTDDIEFRIDSGTAGKENMILMTWVKVRAFGTNRRVLELGEDSGANYWIFDLINANQQMRFLQDSDANAGGTWSVATNNCYIETNTWYHLAFQITSTGAYDYAYCNGLLVESNAAIDMTFSADDCTLYYGVAEAGSFGFMDGEMDETHVILGADISPLDGWTTVSNAWNATKSMKVNP